MNTNNLSRREFLRRMGIGAGSAMALMALEPLNIFADDTPKKTTAGGRMTYRVQHGSGEQISLLGFGMMRLPDDQEAVNRMVDYAIEHGVNYFDTAPMYMGGRSEELMGNALKRHDRSKVFMATKMSNQNQRLWDIAEAKKMYYKSFERLQTDYIDYYLLHSIGGGDGVGNLKGRFIDNGLLDFLMEERKAGRIRHLGFSYHGDVSAFDWLLDRNEQYHWDFVQIQMNFLDWRHAGSGRRRGDADAEYLYTKLEKLGIQCVIMEPLRGGAFARMAPELADQLKAVRPQDSTARWAFRWVGSRPNVLTTLSGMNRMEHVEENVETFSPLEACTEAENALLASVADQMAGFPTIPCTTCAYCMPCPYGVNIPANFAYYNDAVNQGILPLPAPTAPDYAERKKKFTDGYKAALPDLDDWALSCEDCEECLPKCPQQIRIPNQMARIVETLRKK